MKKGGICNLKVVYIGLFFTLLVLLALTIRYLISFLMGNNDESLNYQIKCLELDKEIKRLEDLLNQKEIDTENKVVLEKVPEDIIFTEELEKLDDEHKKYYDAIVSYALSLKDVNVNVRKSYETLTYGKGKIIGKIVVLNGTLIVKFNFGKIKVSKEVEPLLLKTIKIEVKSEKELTEEEIAKKEKQEKWMMNATVAISVVIAVAVFMVLPYFLSSLLKPLMPSYHLRTLVEGFVRIGIFILYIALISRMDDIQRTFMYHGAEHKCINCIEHGLPLTVDNVRISSRQHKRCGTSFLFFVLAISIILLMLIQAESPLMRVIVRIALIPVIAGISYEVLKLAGRSENPIINLLSRPGLAIQKLTTKEPDDSMIEVAIQAVEAVFDWRAYEAENFKTAEDL